MRHLANTISFLLRREGWKNVDLVRASQVSEGLISRIVSGKDDTSLKTLNALALAFPHTADRDELVRAWVLDQLAEIGLSDTDLARLVKAPTQFPQVPPGVRAHLDILIAAAHREDVRDALAGLAALVAQLPAEEARFEAAEEPSLTNPPAPKAAYSKKKK